MPDSIQPAPVTLARAERFIKLCVELGLADDVDAAASPSTSTVKLGATTAAEQVGTPAEPLAQRTAQGGLQVKLGSLLRAVARDGAYVELALILFDVDEEQAEQITTTQLADALPSFALASLSPMQMLLASASDWA